MGLSGAGEKQRFFVRLQQGEKRVLQLLFPPRCAACGEVLPAEQVFMEGSRGDSEVMRLLCPGCIHAFRFITGAVCAKCGREVTDWEEGKATEKLQERGIVSAHVSAQPKAQTGALPIRETGGYRGVSRQTADARLIGEGRAGAGDICRAQSQRLCRDCTKKLRLFAHCFCLMHYEGAARRAMSDIKYRHKKEYLRFFAAAAGEQFGEAIGRLPIDALVPVPVHPKRRRERGYNQAEELCRELSPRLGGIPVVTDLLRRRKKTSPQKKLGADERMLNLRNAFEPYHCYENIRTVLLVDDIYTTGATLEACTEALLKAGVERVYGLCICGGSS